ncbi:MAG: hypothetical protein WCK49_06475 [Myxococcaceae bacterium]
MFKSFLLAILLIFPMERSARADIVTYGIFAVGLVVKNTLSHLSKQQAQQRPLLSVTLRCISDATGLFLLKETGEAALQSFASVAPDWLKSKKTNPLETENTRLQQELANLKSASLASEPMLQAERINELKEQWFSSQLTQTLQKIDEILNSWTFSDNSLTIANYLLELSEQALSLYPIIVDRSINLTGEALLYNKTLLSEKAISLHLRMRISEKTKNYLKDSLEEMIKNSQTSKAQYIRKLFGVLNIDIELSKSTTQSDAETQITDL